MSGSSPPLPKTDVIPIEILSKPSTVIKCFNKTITDNETSYELTLITMKRSFLLVINNIEMGFLQALRTRQDNITMSESELIESFMNKNTLLRGLSLAISGYSTCLIDSANSVASLSLASRLSKTLNDNGPVYVANNMEAPDRLDVIYRQVFQFILKSMVVRTGHNKSS